MKHLNTRITLVLMMAYFIFGGNLQAQDTEVHPSSVPSGSPIDAALIPDMTGETPELVAPTEADAGLSAEISRATKFYTALMWAVYSGTGEQNISESKVAYDALIEEFGVDTEITSSSPATGNQFVSLSDLSFIYTGRATLRFNTLQNIKGAEDDVRIAIGLDPENVPATWLLAQILTRRVFSSIQANRRDTRAQALQEEMLSVLKQVIALDPDHDRAHYYLGTMARDLGQIELAVTSFKALTRIMPFDAQFHRELGELYKLQNRFEEALHCYERVITILPEQLSARNHLGQLYLRTGNYPEAIKTLTKVLTSDPNHVGALSGMGMAYQILEELELAETYLRRAIAAPSKSELPEVYNALGYLYAEQGVKLDEAAALVRRALRSSPTSGAYLDSLGFIYFKQGKLDAAIKNLELAIRYLPDTPVILLHLADAYLQKGLKKKALRTLEKAVRLEPDNAELRQKLEAVQ